MNVGGALEECADNQREVEDNRVKRGKRKVGYKEIGGRIEEDQNRWRTQRPWMGKGRLGTGSGGRILSGKERK